MIRDLDIKILNRLVESGDFIPINRLAEEFNLTNRKVRYSIECINFFIKNNGLGELEINKRKGVRLPQDNYVLDSLNSKEMIYKNYFGFSNEDRVILYIIKSKYPKSIFEIANFLGVSRGTVQKYLNNIEDSYGNIGLVRKRNKGIYILNDEINKRKTIKDILDKYTNYNIQSLMTPQNVEETAVSYYFDGFNIKYIIEKIIELLSFQKLEPTDMSLYNLVINILISMKRIRQGFTIDKSNINIKEESHDLVEVMKSIYNKHLLSLSDNEIEYILPYFYSMGNFTTIKDEKEIYDKELYDVIKTSVEIFEQISRLKLDKKDEIILGLMTHLKSAINRMIYKIYIKNPVKEDILKEYRDIYSYTKQACKNIEDKYNIKFNDDELSYICMHFGAVVEKSREIKNIKKRVVIVCSSGVGTSKLLANKITNMFDDVDIVDILSLNRFYKKRYYDVDLCISTINMHDAYIPTIVVSPLLTSEDIEKLSKYFNLKTKKEYNVEDILEIIDKYANIQNRELLKNELKSYLDGQKINDYKNEINLNPRCISLNKTFEKAEDALIFSANLLYDEGYVNKEFIAHIKESTNKKGKNGPYIVISKGIALPHGGALEGAIETGFSIVTLKKPINFGHKKHDPIKIIICFSTKDNKSHLDTLNKIINLLSNGDGYKKITNATEVEKVIELVNNGRFV